MTAKLATTYQLNKALEAGQISWHDYHLALLQINESED